MQQVLLNEELIAIQQDYTMPPGDQTSSCGDDAWTRRLSNGGMAVGVVNMGSKKKDVSVCFSDVGWEGTANVRDIWNNLTHLGE
jgi:alpha-galactosidase